MIGKDEKEELISPFFQGLPVKVGDDLVDSGVDTLESFPVSFVKIEVVEPVGFGETEQDQIPGFIIEEPGRDGSPD